MRSGSAKASGVSSRQLADRLHAFFTQRIWAVRLADLRRGKALLYRVSRVGYASVRGFAANRLTTRAAALTYYSVLSIVPFLAFAFAVLKGFGAYTSFVQGTLRPYVRETFGANPALLRSVERILEFVDRTNVSTLGALGLLTLVYTSVSLLASVEDTLNEVWGAKTKRSFLRQVTDYVTLLVTTPLLVVAAVTAATAAQSSRIVLFLRDTLELGGLIDFLLQFTSVAVVGVAFFAIYTILPNVRTRPLSAAIGAVVAAVLWQIALVLYVRFQIGVSSYNALYSVLSAVPVFLVWTYASWLVVLIGAQVAAGHQNERTVRQQLRAPRADQALKEMLALVAVAHVAREFTVRGPWRGQAALADVLGVSPLTMDEVVDALVRAGVLARTTRGPDVCYVPARDLDAIRVEDVREALRRDPELEEIRAAVVDQVGADLERILGAAEEESRSSDRNVTLRDLGAVLARSEPPARAAAPRSPSVAPPGAPDTHSVMDAK